MNIGYNGDWQELTIADYRYRDYQESTLPTRNVVDTGPRIEGLADWLRGVWTMSASAAVSSQGLTSPALGETCVPNGHRAVKREAKVNTF